MLFIFIRVFQKINFKLIQVFNMSVPEINVEHLPDDLSFHTYRPLRSNLNNEWKSLLKLFTLIVEMF